MTAPPAPSSAPLSGMLVADLSRVLAGPYATMLLADLGADVVKVEHPERGDDTRAWGPPWAGDQSAYYLALNRGKRSLAVDLKDPDGLAAVRTLCARADVVVQNFRPGTAERLGLGYADVAADNPGVVYCSISGFGPGHLRPDRPGFDVVIQGESGLMSTTGTPEGGPNKIGIPLADVLTGLNATTAVCAALVRRATTGRGEHIHVSLLNSALSALVQVGQSALVTGAEPERVGHAHPSIVPYQTFPTADGDIIIAAGNDALYRALCTVVERPDLAEDPRFRRNADRVAHRDILVAELTAALAKRSAEEWTALLSDAGVPVGKVRGVAEALRTADASGDEATMTVDHPVLGAVELIRPGFRFTGAAPQHGPAVLPPPLLGQHSVEVLRELGLSEERITALVERGTVVQHPVH